MEAKNSVLRLHVRVPAGPIDLQSQILEEDGGRRDAPFYPLVPSATLGTTHSAPHTPFPSPSRIFPISAIAQNVGLTPHPCSRRATPCPLPWPCSYRCVTPIQSPSPGLSSQLALWARQ
uniref:Uncharacterized protein n=1 Tax=Eutreptiella gymnastica TaxID=73025 RepID=A0A7S1JD91_9EUGL|mmetsp:Transcript_87109/g.151563  ORF Transcript_87109/g.151563 Transcript_87109/m.151563 type:complete len:119 (+) Transcript_87109:374-730(+)